MKMLKGYNAPSSAPILYQNTILTDPKEKANAFAENHVSTPATNTVVLQNYSEILTEAAQRNEDEYNKDICYEELIQSLNDCSNSSPGEDCVTYDMLKSLTEKTVMNYFPFITKASTLG